MGKKGRGLIKGPCLGRGGGWQFQQDLKALWCSCSLQDVREERTEGSGGISERDLLKSELGRRHTAPEVI